MEDRMKLQDLDSDKKLQAILNILLVVSTVTATAVAMRWI